jgi:Holliday junction resolvasome RuvABC endonuclease subunit
MSLTENKIYRILGVDPGTVKMGYALLEINGNQMKYMEIKANQWKSLEIK